MLVMASTPTYDPNLVEKRTSAGSINVVRAPCEPASPLLNRATQGPVFIPGSTFKVVTAAAALDSRRYTPDEHVRGSRLLHRVREAGLQLRRPVGPERVRHGRLRRGGRELDQLGLLQHRQGARRRGALLDYSKRFGFYEDPPLETPGDERTPERPLLQGQALRPERPEPDRPGPARLRPGAAARDAAPDGDGRRRRSRTAASSWSRTSSTGSSRPTATSSRGRRPTRSAA